jgi:hypothetical protein
MDFWYVRPCCLVERLQCFRENYFIHLQGTRVQKAAPHTLPLCIVRNTHECMRTKCFRDVTLFSFSWLSFLRWSIVDVLRRIRNWNYLLAARIKKTLQSRVSLVVFIGVSLNINIDKYTHFSSNTTIHSSILRSTIEHSAGRKLSLCHVTL